MVLYTGPINLPHLVICANNICFGLKKQAKLTFVGFTGRNRQKRRYIKQLYWEHRKTYFRPRGYAEPPWVKFCARAHAHTQSGKKRLRWRSCRQNKLLHLERCNTFHTCNDFQKLRAQRRNYDEQEILKTVWYTNKKLEQTQFCVAYIQMTEQYVCHSRWPILACCHIQWITFFH